MSASMNKAVFLDRDGTLSEEIGYIHAADLPRFALLPRTAAGLRRLREAGYLLVVLTNQSGVARGYFPAAQVDAVHDRLRLLLANEGVALDAVYYCPHHPEPLAPADNGQLPPGRVAAQPVAALNIDCDCRKPKPGLALRAARDLGIDLGRSWMLGDKSADLGLAQAAGLKGGVLVLTGYGQGTLEKMKAQGRSPQYIATDVLDAVETILQLERSTEDGARA